MFPHAIRISRAILAAQISRHPTLATLTKRRFRHSGAGRDDIAYSKYIYSAFRPLCPGGRSLEIGPGSSLGVSALLARDGCDAVAMDIMDLRNPTDDATIGELLEGSSARVKYVLGYIEEIPFEPGSFDFVFSNSALEHVRDPARALREIYRILRTGGRTVHQIDFRDHRNFNDPLCFLQYGDSLWNLMNSSGPGHQNRWRFSEWVAALRKTGFNISSIEINMVAEPRHLARKDRFAERYRGMPAGDLTTLSARIAADK